MVWTHRLLISRCDFCNRILTKQSWFLLLIHQTSTFPHCVPWEKRVETEHVPKFKLNLTCSNWSFQTRKDALPLPICLSQICVCDVEWGRHMSAEPSMPPTGSTNNEFLKGSTGWGGVESFFFSSSFCQSPSAWFLPWSTHSWTFNSFQLPYFGASAASDSESRAIVTTTELVLSFKLGGLGTYNAEQLTRWERPTDFCLFLYASMWGNLSVCFIYGVCSISNQTDTESFTGYSVFTMNKTSEYFHCRRLQHLKVFTLCKTSVALLNEGRLTKTMMYF